MSGPPIIDTFKKLVESGDRIRSIEGCTSGTLGFLLDEVSKGKKFSEALKTVGKQLEFEDLYKKRETFRDQIKEVIGRDLNGFVLDDVAIDYLEQTPLELLDAQNILDAIGIKKITEITTVQNVFTNELRQKERMDIGSQNLKSDEALFQFNQRRSEAEAKANKEIASVNSREQQEAQRIADDGHRTQAHGCRGDDGTEQYSEYRIQHASSQWDPEHVVDKGQKQVLADVLPLYADRLDHRTEGLLALNRCRRTGDPADHHAIRRT